MADGSSVVIVGAASAGLSVAVTLRRDGCSRPIVLVGAETHLPYDRPPLSKQVLAGTWGAAEILLRPADAYDELDLDLQLGRRAVALDVGGRRITLDDGEVLEWGDVVIATGVIPRRLPGLHELPRVHVLRTFDDAVALRSDLEVAERLLVIGAGVLGTEVAATARLQGLGVVVIDPLLTPLGRVVGPTIGGLVQELHERNGVDVRMRVGLDGLVDEGGRIRAWFDDGSVATFDAVLVAAGATPDVGWLHRAGLSTADGLDCNAHCVAGPRVHGAGDVASWLSTRFGRRMRVEHKMNAVEHGAAVARQLMGDNDPFDPVPYFWTDQYDVKIQVHGICPPDAEVVIASGDPAGGSFTALYGACGVVVGVLGWKRPKDVVRLRQLVVDRVSWQDALSSAADALTVRSPQSA